MLPVPAGLFIGFGGGSCPGSGAGSGCVRTAGSRYRGVQQAVAGGVFERVHELVYTLWSLKTLARRAAQKRKLLSVITERGKVLKSKDVLAWAGA